jgi:arylsulfatase A-like enzyme
VGRLALIALGLGIALPLAVAIAVGPEPKPRPAEAPTAPPPVESSAGRVVYDLLANRTAAHGIFADGLLVWAGVPGFAKYVRFGHPSMPWRMGRRVDGQVVAALTADRATLRLPLTLEQARRERLFLRVHAASPRTLLLALNGEPAGRIALLGGWQLVEVAPRPGQQRGGENELLLNVEGPPVDASCLDRRRPGASCGLDDAAGPSEGPRLSLQWLLMGSTLTSVQPETVPRPPTGEGLPMSSGGGVAYYLAPTGRTVLRPGAMHRVAAGCALKLRQLEDRGLVSEVTLPVVDAKLASREPVVPQTQVPLLHRGDGGVLRVELVGDGSCDGGLLSGGALVRSDARVAPWESGGHAVPGRASPLGPISATALPKRPRNVLLWIIDSLRASRLSLYNPKARAEIPSLERLARRGVVFRQHYVQGNESRASHASLWTGVYPGLHRMINGSARLASSWTTLPEGLAAASVSAYGRTGNGWICEKWGFGEGWSLLHNAIRQGGGLAAQEFANYAGSFLATGAAAKPFFLYLGTIDTHVSWRARRPWIDRYDPVPYGGPLRSGFTGPQLGEYLSGELQLTERDKQRVLALYDSDISYNDHAFGQVLDQLESRGILDDTLIVVTSDHGDEFWDHGRVGHGQSIKEELVAVPLIMSYPPLLPPGTVVDEGVEIVDVLPTVMDAVGSPIPDEVQGMSLLPLAQGREGGYPQPSIATQYEKAHAIRAGRFKLWEASGKAPKLSDLETDPLERTDIAEDRPLVRRWLEDGLSLWMVYQKRWRKRRWGTALNHRAELAADLEAEPTTAP